MRYLVHSVYSDNDLVLFYLRWKETRLTDKKSLKVYCEGLWFFWSWYCFNLCWKSDYELGFYSNQFWGLPKLTCFHKTLKSISVRKSWNYCTSASSNHDLLLNHHLKKCHSFSNHYKWNFIGFTNLGFYNMSKIINIYSRRCTCSTLTVTYPFLRLTWHRLQEHVVYSPWFSSR